MKFFARVSLLLGIVLLNLFSGCESLEQLVREPAVSLNSVELAGITLDGVNLIARVDVENPNAFSVPLPKIDWELFINTASFVKGVLPGGQSLKGGGKATVDLPVSLTYEGLFRSFSSLIETKEAAYDIALGVSFPIPVIESKVFNLDFSGVIPLPQLPKLSPGRMKISKIDFTGVEMAWEVNVENPNQFSIPFPEINWDYGVNGVPVLKSKFAGAGAIAAGAAGAALISVGVAYADVFKATASALTAGDARSSLALDSAVPIPALAGLKNALDIPGTLPILRKPEVKFQGITRKSLGRTMEFILNWEVENKNTFDFAVEEFNYDFSVNNSRWAKGVVANPPRLAAGSKTVIPVTVSVSAVSLVAELVGIISRGAPVNYNCAGGMSLSAGLPGLEKLELPLDLKGSVTIR